MGELSGIKRTDNSFLHLNNDLMAVMHMQMKGENLLQLGCFIVNMRFEWDKQYGCWHEFIKPRFPEMLPDNVRNKIYSESLMDYVSSGDSFLKWVGKLPLRHNKQLQILCHDWPHLSETLRDWLGQLNYDRYISKSYRDLLPVTNFIKDVAHEDLARIPYPKPQLGSILTNTSLYLSAKEDSLQFCKYILEAYRRMCQNRQLYWQMIFDPAFQYPEPIPGPETKET